MSLIKIKIINKTGKITEEQVEAERVSGTENFYVFEKILDDKYKAYSLTIVPLGLAIIHFKYKKDAVKAAKEFNNSGINFNRKREEIGKDKILRDLMYKIMNEINASSNYIRVGRIKDFPIKK